MGWTRYYNFNLCCGETVKIRYLIPLLFTVSALAYTCPSGYTALSSLNASYVDGQGIGANIPRSICVQTSPSGNYSNASFYWPAPTATSCAVSVNIGQQGDPVNNSMMNTIVAASGGACTVTSPLLVAGTNPYFSFANCQGATCTRFSLDTGSGGWSSAPFGSEVSGYSITPSGFLPLPPAGTPSWTIAIDGGDSTPPAGHIALAPIIGLLNSGSAPVSASYAITVNGSPCTASLAGCIISNVTVQIQCGYAFGPRSATNDWSVSILGSNFLCGGSPIGYPGSLNGEIVATLGNSASGSYDIHVTAQGLDSSNNPIGASTSDDYNFTVTAPTTVTKMNPSSYPALPSGAVNKWMYYVASQNNPAAQVPGYMFYLNGWLNSEIVAPGKYFNDASSATLWDIPPWGLGFYDIGRFPQQMYFMLGNCHTSNANPPCTNWSAHAGVSQGQILDNSSCLLVVIQNGTTGSSSPTCPTVCSGSFTGYHGLGCQLAVDGTAQEASLGTATDWLQWAQHEGDEFRNSKLLALGNTFAGGSSLPSQEWDSFTIGYDERYWMRSNLPGTPEIQDKTAIGCMLSPFIAFDGCTLANKLSNDAQVPIGTVRSQPLELDCYRYVVEDYWY